MGVKHLDMGHPVDIIYLYFQKSLNKVFIGLKKESCQIIGGKVLSWIESWLKDRKQCVELNGHYLGYMEVRSKSPAGICAGPNVVQHFHQCPGNRDSQQNLQICRCY